ncbi:glycosyltransferase family 4 protein [Dysgonomonas termitidis]|uniref:Glycosyltransferase family 4 protein n=2 Tax=Dysgonomonas termitidis TaxID=1516126 RepID=A0ABV9KSF7_9BACT
MEKQCYELVTGMEKKSKTHRLVFDRKGSKFTFFLTLGRKIKRVCKENPGINIIYFNDALIACFCSFLNLPKNIAYVVTLHGLDVVFPSRLYHKYILTRLNYYHCLIAVSNATARKAIDSGLDRDKITVIPNGVDISMFQEIPEEIFTTWLSEKGICLSNRKILMLLGRPVKRKGFSWFAGHVFPLLRQDQFYLIIAGPFHNKIRLQERLIYMLPAIFRNKLMLFSGYFSDEKLLRKIIYKSENIKHLGRLSYSEIQMLFSRAEAFLMPNIATDGDMEGFGLVCLEASVNKALVLASDIDGIPDAIIDGKNGFLLPSNDAGAWAEKLNYMIGEREHESFNQYRSEFSSFTRANFNWERMVNDYYKVFTGLKSNMK